MTQPSLTGTFDTSLVEVSRSFSSTDTNTSGSVAEEPLAPDDRGTATDGDVASTSSSSRRECAPPHFHDEVLQTIDDDEMRHWIPRFVAALQQNAVSDPNRILRVLDLECASGRNTAKLLRAGWSRPAALAAWDPSAALLHQARARCQPEAAHVATAFYVVDLAAPDGVPRHALASFDGVVAALPSERIPPASLFAAVARLLRPGAYALLSRRHPDVDRCMPAGGGPAFGVCPGDATDAGSVQAGVEAARRAGLEVLGPPKEVAMHENMACRIRLGSTARETARRLVGVNVWVGMWVRKV